MTKEINSIEILELDKFSNCESVNISLNVKFTSEHLLNANFFQKFGSGFKSVKISSSTINWKWEVFLEVFQNCKNLENLEFVLEKCPYVFPVIDDKESIHPLENLKSFKFYVRFIEDFGPEEENYEEDEPMFIKPTDFPSNFNKFMTLVFKYLSNVKELQITTKDYYLDEGYLSWIYDYIWYHQSEVFPNIDRDAIPTKYPETLGPFRLKHILESNSFNSLTSSSPWILLNKPDSEVNSDHYRQFLEKLSNSKSSVTKLTLTSPVYENVGDIFPTQHSFGSRLNHLILQYWNEPMDFITTLSGLKELELHESDLNACILNNKNETPLQRLEELFGSFRDLDVMFSNCRGSHQISNEICQAFDERNVTFSVTD